MQFTEARKQAYANSKQLTAEETRYIAKAALNSLGTGNDIFDVIEEVFQVGYQLGQEAHTPATDPAEEPRDLLTESDLAAVGDSACYGELA